MAFFALLFRLTRYSGLCGASLPAISSGASEHIFHNVRLGHFAPLHGYLMYRPRKAKRGARGFTPEGDTGYSVSTGCYCYNSA